jgi:hypothetical protein
MRSLFAAALLACSVHPVQAADEENVFKNVKIGDWVEYKMFGLNDGKSKMTVVAKDDKEVTYELATTIKLEGKESTSPVRKVTIDLAKPYDPLTAANLRPEDQAKIETLGEGKEKIKVGDKEFETKWIKMKVTVPIMGMMINVSEFKMWFSKEAPLSGMVKMEETNVLTLAKKTYTNKITLELIGSGRK